MATVEQRQARAMAKALGISYTLALKQVREAYAEWKYANKVRQNDPEPYWEREQL